MWFNTDKIKHYGVLVVRRAHISRDRGIINISLSSPWLCLTCCSLSREIQENSGLYFTTCGSCASYCLGTHKQWEMLVCYSSQSECPSWFHLIQRLWNLDRVYVCVLSELSNQLYPKIWISTSLYELLCILSHLSSFIHVFLNVCSLLGALCLKLAVWGFRRTWHSIVLEPCSC
jgi:hypothetical protein